jgi:hypothetical protein
MVFVLAATALAGCCASGTGCPVSLPPDLATSDGLVTMPEDSPPPADPSPTTKKVRSKPKMAAETMGTSGDAKSDPDRAYAEQQAAEQAADAELTRHLKICSGCASSGRDTRATDSMGDTMGAGTAGTSRAKARDTADTVD